MGLGVFLPEVPVDAPRRELRCRAALASTFLAGLELARSDTLLLSQDVGFAMIHVRVAACG